MSSFLTTAPSRPATETPIVSSPFWPAVDPVDIRDDQRIDNSITPARLKAALIEAIASTNSALAAWRIAQQAAGIETLAAVACETIDETSIHVHRYRRAVGCLAKALLLERYRDFDTTGKGDKKAEQLTDPIDDCRRDHLAAIADIAGQPRTTVELI
ncbi:head completion/stabilization protein [Dechloromonas denitrificans]|uniref:head completion/stabilization protein n=1 Tax=Dechloromonas denitrificans TaxID=281362 RepID=UPI001CF81B48|nr:head completion/stabilization protein [Dechloromonas denitrificans]UCV02293.1 head completion/stabilization protein [Dechloromonas denitrificans]